MPNMLNCVSQFRKQCRDHMLVVAGLIGIRLKPQTRITRSWGSLPIPTKALGGTSEMTLGMQSSWRYFRATPSEELSLSIWGAIYVGDLAFQKLLQNDYGKLLQDEEIVKAYDPSRTKELKDGAESESDSDDGAWDSSFMFGKFKEPVSDYSLSGPFMLGFSIRISTFLTLLLCRYEGCVWEDQNHRPRGTS